MSTSQLPNRIVFGSLFPPNRSSTRGLTLGYTSFDRLIRAARSNGVNPAWPNPPLISDAPGPLTPLLDLEAPTVGGLANYVLEAMWRCRAESDATMMYAPTCLMVYVSCNKLGRICYSQTFRTCYRAASDGSGTNSSGPGVDREVWLTLEDRLIQPGGRLRPRFEELLVFNPSTSEPTVPSSEAQLIQAWSIGAFLTTYLMVHGNLPGQYSVLHYWLALHNGDMSCLTREILQEFAPGILPVIDGWTAAGPSATSAPILESYLDAQVCRVRLTLSAILTNLML